MRKSELINSQFYFKIQILNKNKEMNKQLCSQIFEERLNPNILKRCQEVIQELSYEVKTVEKQYKQQSHLLQILTSQKNTYMNEFKQNQALIHQLKIINSKMKLELDFLKEDKSYQNTLKLIKQQLLQKTNELDQNKKMMALLSTKLKNQENCLKQSQQQHVIQIKKFNGKIKMLEKQLLNKEEEISNLFTIVNNKCSCQQILQQINNMKHIIQSRYITQSNQSPSRKAPLLEAADNNSSQYRQIYKQKQIQQQQTKSTARSHLRNSSRSNKIKMNNIYLSEPENFHQKFGKVVTPFKLNDPQTDRQQNDSLYNTPPNQQHSKYTTTEFNPLLLHPQQSYIKNYDRRKVQATLDELQFKLSKLITSANDQHSQQGDD